MKHRNVFALEAWTRKGGAHSGPKKPDYDETEEGLEEYEEEKKHEQEKNVVTWGCKFPPRLSSSY
jgi:hypothetical protein